MTVSDLEPSCDGSDNAIKLVGNSHVTFRRRIFIRRLIEFHDRTQILFLRNVTGNSNVIGLRNHSNWLATDCVYL